MWWMLACVDPFPPYQGPSETGGDSADADTDADTDTDSDADTDSDSDADVDPLAVHTDEFDGDGPHWTSITTSDGTFNRVIAFEIAGSQARLVPEGSAWFEAYRGVLEFQDIEGDFVVTSHVTVLNAAGESVPPRARFSYAGLMARAPRDGYEDYGLIAIGTGESTAPSTLIAEAKVTVHSGAPIRDELPLIDDDADLAIARLGTLLVLLQRDEPADPWQIRYRQCLADLPATLQVGMLAGADFDACFALTVEDYDDQHVTTADADLDSRFDYVRFETPPQVADPCGTYDQGTTANDGALLALLAPWLH